MYTTHGCYGISHLIHFSNCSYPAASYMKYVSPVVTHKYGHFCLCHILQNMDTIHSMPSGGRPKMMLSNDSSRHI